MGESVVAAIKKPLPGALAGRLGALKGAALGIDVCILPLARALFSRISPDVRVAEAVVGGELE